jgi:GNAT superfamily N-acetyltransferase
MDIVIRNAEARDIEVVSSILIEVARWLEDRGTPLWRAKELAPEHIKGEVLGGLFVLAELGGEAVGTMRYQLEDPLFWPDVPPGESAYIHRLAVRRRAAGGLASRPLLEWAVKHTKSIGRRYLRLDTDASRPKLRAVYEQFGFRHHSDRTVGPYYVARYEYDVLSPMLNYTISRKWDDSSKVVMEGLKSFNAPFLGSDTPRQLQIIVRTNDGDIVAGLLGETHWDWMYVGWVWVRDDHRIHGIGTRLMQNAEDQAREMGCLHAHLTTLDFQAKGFYEKLGYQVFAALEDYPKGHTRFMMKKYIRSSDQRT